MKKTTVTQLVDILAEHKLWLDTSGQGGKRADLSYADLKGADLKGADLYGANLTDANLTGTIFEKKTENNKNVCVNSSFGEELQVLLDKHGVKLAAAIQLELK